MLSFNVITEIDSSQKLQPFSVVQVPTHVGDTRTLVASRTCSSFGDGTFATTSLEQSAAQSQTTWGVIRPVQVVTEHVFIRTVRPQHTVNYFYLRRIVFS